MQRSDAEYERVGEGKAAPGKGESSSTSSSSSSTSSPRTVQKRTPTKRKREDQDGTGTAKEKKEAKPERKQLPSTTAKRQTETKAEKRDDSPDMVEEILGWRDSSKREAETTPPAKRKAEEDDPSKRNTVSGNTKERKQEETAKEERRQRIPPPASARVDESKIDELAVARLEAARKGTAGPEAAREMRQIPTAEEERARIPQERPASPMRPREDSPIEGDSDTETLRMEDEQPAESGKAPSQDWKWHSDAKPAEPARAPRHSDLDQTAYWVLWLGKSEECRQVWEKEWNKDQAKRDEEELAKRIYNLDKGVREGTTYEELQKLLSKLQGKEEEEWQTAKSDRAVTSATDGGYEARWESYSWNN